MKRKAARPYESSVRRRQAEDTRTRILEAARHVLERRGYAGATMDAIAGEAGVAVQTVYAVFGSKTGIVLDLIDRATFGPEYEQLVQRALAEPESEQRLRFAAKIARSIYDAQSPILDLLQGASVVAPAVARLQKEREHTRYERQESVIAFLENAGRLRTGLKRESARDILWTLTGREPYRMLVRERGWSSQDYEDWVAGMLIAALLEKKRAREKRLRK
jgi:AcrR family transcriptional regulator